MTRWTRGRTIRALVAGAMLAGVAPARATAETCLSPYVKRLDRQEKYLYVFCVDADAKDNDFIAVWAAGRLVRYLVVAFISVG